MSQPTHRMHTFISEPIYLDPPDSLCRLEVKNAKVAAYPVSDTKQTDMRFNSGLQLVQEAIFL
jgi:hypothetical protein